MMREKSSLVETAHTHEFEMIRLGIDRLHMDLPEYGWCPWDGAVSWDCSRMYGRSLLSLMACIPPPAWRLASETPCRGSA